MALWYDLDITNAQKFTHRQRWCQSVIFFKRQGLLEGKWDTDAVGYTWTNLSHGSVSPVSALLTKTKLYLLFIQSYLENSILPIVPTMV